MSSTMAKLRSDPRHTVPRTTNNSKKSEKWETLKGWQTPNEADDTDIENWARRRRQTDEKAANSRWGYPNVCDPFFCSFTPLCEDIDDVIAFKQYSLCQRLNPHQKHHKDLNNDGKFGNSVQDQDDISQTGRGASGTKCDTKGDTNNDTGCNGEHQHESEVEKSSHAEDKNTDNIRLQEKNGEQSNDSCVVTSDKQSTVSGTTETRDVTSAAARARRLIVIARNNSNRQSSAGTQPHDVISGQDEEEGPTLDNGHSSHQPHNDTSEADTTERDGTSSQSGKLANNVTDFNVHRKPELPPRSFKLSYTQSNITLRNPYTSEHSLDVLGGPTNHNGVRSVTFMEDASDNVAYGGPSGFVTSLQSLKENLRTTSAHSDSALSHRSMANNMVTLTDGNRSKPSDDIQLKTKYISHEEEHMLPMQNDAQTNDDAQGRKRSAISQRQVSLVLKTVTIQDANKTNEGAKNTEVPVILHPGSLQAKTVTKRHTNGFLRPSDFSDASLSQHSMPLGDLLPAVDTNIRGRLVTRVGKVQEDGDHEDNIYNLDTGSLMIGKDKLLANEESIFLMREGVELSALKERQQSILGPPAFRPPSNKSPLQRAKENSSKRIYGNLNQTANISYTDMNKMRWQTSGTFYTSGRGATSEGETMSAPVTGRLCRGRKPLRPTARPLGGHPSYHTNGSSHSAGGILTNTTTTDSTTSVTKVELAHIRDKLPTKKTE